MLLGSIADADVLDDLFLTISPLIAGRTGTSSRPGIVDGVAFRPDAFVPMTLLSIRRHGSVLFLRYRSASHHDAPASVGRKGST
jgi:hypothetical protein